MRLAQNKYPKRTGTFALMIVSTVICAVQQAEAKSLEELRIRIEVGSNRQPRLAIHLSSSESHQHWTFRNVYGPVVGLSERIKNFQGLDLHGVAIASRKDGPGEFTTAAAIKQVDYEVDLTTPIKANDKSHVSSLDENQGVLMMADLLPQFGSKDPPAVTIEIKAPEGWTISTNTEGSNSVFETKDPDGAVFLMGASIRQERFNFGSHNLLVACSSDWPFSPDEIAKWALKLIREYSVLTGFELHGNAAVMLLPLPGQFGADHWSAETRGNDVVLQLGRNATRSQLLARLGVVLTHEVFHFWVPGSLSVNGDYDWFFEGFTLYEALCTALKLKLIDFREFLATLARVNDSYLSTVDADRLSLIDLSQRRWTSSPSLVYEKSMLVAFLFDLQLRRMSSAQSSFGQIYREVFKSDHSTRDANEVILNTVDHLLGTNEFSNRYIRTPVKIDLTSILPSYGILVERNSFHTQLSIDKRLDEQQLGLLRKLGFEK